MKTTLRTGAFAISMVTALLLGGMAYAQNAPSADQSAVATRQGRAIERFKAADTDHDGLISREEAAKSMPRLAQHFDQIDSNKDGKLSPDELKAMHDQMRAQHGSGHGNGMGKMAGHQPGGRCLSADTDHDGFVSRAEAQAVGTHFLARFDAADSAKEGKLAIAALCPGRTPSAQ